MDVTFAVALEDSIVNPIVRLSNQKSLGEIAQETTDLIARAREDKLVEEEYEGGTFTISNLGMYGNKEFTSIINRQQSSVLAIGSTERKLVFNENAENNAE